MVVQATSESFRQLSSQQQIGMKDSLHQYLGFVVTMSSSVGIREADRLLGVRFTRWTDTSLAFPGSLHCYGACPARPVDHICHRKFAG